MQENYAPFSKIRYIFPAKIPLAAAKATAVWQTPRRRSTSRNSLPAAFCERKKGAKVGVPR